MSYQSTVYRVLIASPSDVHEEREVTTRLIQNWNDVNSFSKKIVLLPLKWETHSSPTYDVRPQEAINRQLVDSADLVIGLFWAKIGSDTGVEISGTIEEIKRAANNGKDVMIYFSKRGIDPSAIDLNQLKALNDFKEEVYKNALVETFSSVIDFRDKLNRQLEYKIRELQKNNNADSKKLDISFVNKEVNDLDKNEIIIEKDFIEMSKEQLTEILDKHKDLYDTSDDTSFDYWFLKNTVNEYLEQFNTIPIVLGIKNIDNIIHSDLNTDIQIRTNIADSLNISLVGATKDSDINSLRGKIKSEDEEKIYSLFNESIEKIDSRTMSIFTRSMTILPNKIKCIKPIILISPKEDIELSFNIKLLSNSILDSI